MKKLLLSLVLCGLFASPAYALTLHLKGKKADAFIAKHFPNASIPGPVEGSFTYGVLHYKRYGRASCNVPAMGARSDGAVSTCMVKY
jgi:hypothetical protein